MWRYFPALFSAGLICLTGCQMGGDQKLGSNSPAQATTLNNNKEIKTVSNTTSENESDAEWTTTASGLKYRILRAGNETKPTKSDTVEVHYKGWLDDGTEFDSSYKRNQSISFPLSGVIAGWTEGMTYVSEGGEIELEIPADIGYGSRGAPPAIPPGATLHFTVELLEVK